MHGLPALLHGTAIETLCSRAVVPNLGSTDPLGVRGMV